MFNRLRLIEVMFFAVLMIGFVNCGGNFQRRSEIESGFDQVTKGQTMDIVQKLMGNPSEISECAKPQIPNKFSEKCDKIFRYYYEIDRWSVFFDKKGHVIDKVQSTSY